MPLIGGLPISCQLSFDTLPEFIASTVGFQENDKHYVNYLKTKYGYTENKYYILDGTEKPSYMPNCSLGCPSVQLRSLDVVAMVPPCKGLSSLSTISSADSNINNFMIEGSKYVLSELQPKIVFAENAPRLSSLSGKKVADQLYNIGKEFGYWFTMYYTESRLHGNIQIRPRTYFFFIRKDVFDNKIPLCDYYNRPQETIFDVFSRIDYTNKNDLMLKLSYGFNSKTLDKDIFYNYLKWYYRADTHESLIKSVCEDHRNKYPNKQLGSVNMVRWCKELFGSNTAFGHEYEKFVNNVLQREINKEEQKWLDRFERIDAKEASGGGGWYHDMTVTITNSPAFVGCKILTFLHPTEKRALNFREQLTMMGMPQDFSLYAPSGNYRKDNNHICQNVPVYTTKDITDSIVKWLTTDTYNYIDIKDMNGDYIVQNNKKQTISYRNA